MWETVLSQNSSRPGEEPGQWASCAYQPTSQLRGVFTQLANVQGVEPNKILRYILLSNGKSKQEIQ